MQNQNPQTEESFADRLVTIMNHGALCLMTSIGHRTGLFDAMERMDAATSGEIAREAGLDERYVREWLGAMTTGGIIECNGEGKRYRLPEEHAAFLTRKSPADNLAVLAQYIPIMGAVEDEIVECFRKGGGVPYSSYGRFHEVMAEDSGQSVVSSLVDVILPLAPEVVERLESGIDVLDVGCGSGRAVNLMAKTYPGSRFTGYDLSEEAVRRARAEAEAMRLGNARFEVRDLTTFDEDAPKDRFHLVTAFDAIHDQARPDRVLRGIAKALKPGGTFLMQDIAGSSHVHKNLDHPIGSLLYTISCLHCMTVSLAQGGMGLGAMWGEEKALEMLREAGLPEVEVKRLDHDIQNNYYIAKKSRKAARKAA
jgi:2-polyprenyl-3-methyl-5-hydroxy-6-metoxy-1,4-benzoquinol methylase